MSDLVRTGMSLDERTVQRLDDLAENWNERRAHQVKRSEMAREVLPLGITALEIIDEATDRNMTMHDRQGALRAALYSYDDLGDSDDTDVLVRELADREGVDPDELEQAILRLRLDE